MTPERARYVDLVQALRLARVVAGLSRRDVSEQVGVTAHTVMQWENCKPRRSRLPAMPSVLALMRWAETVGVRL